VAKRYDRRRPEWWIPGHDRHRWFRRSTMKE